MQRYPLLLYSFLQSPIVSIPLCWRGLEPTWGQGECQCGWSQKQIRPRPTLGYSGLHLAVVHMTQTQGPMFAFCVWLLSLNLMSSWFIHVVAYVQISFLFKAEWYSILCIYCILFIHLPVGGHWAVSTFWLLWKVLLWTLVYNYPLEFLLSVLLGIYLETELLILWNRESFEAQIFIEAKQKTTGQWKEHVLWVMGPKKQQRKRASSGGTHLCV